MHYQSTPKPLLVYLHGFMSSPNSVKAKETEFYIAKRAIVVEYLVPTLSDHPKQAYQQLSELIQANPSRTIGLIGSSMGGFFASALAARFTCRAVLINPAVAPQNLMQKYIGEQINPYTNNHFTLTVNDMEFLQDLEVECPQPDKIMLLVQTGDETLDYKDAVAKYVGSPQVVEEGGDHRFQDFDKHLPSIMKFLFAPSTELK
ncbi:MAG: putative esterase YcpF (UPF0227 family) [Pseudomonadales bacterium]|jgi:predicted esterase YcpF (UPF0227 family)